MRCQSYKNGQGVLNVQIELLQVTDTQNPTSTFKVNVSVDEEISGVFAPTGTATVEAIATKFGLKIALNEEARNNITEKIAPENWEKYFMGNEGEFTMYMDLVKGVYAKNSTTPEENRLPIDFEGGIPAMFKIIRTNH